jgi:hypothetical protein
LPIVSTGKTVSSSGTTVPRDIVSNRVDGGESNEKDSIEEVSPEKTK